MRQSHRLPRGRDAGAEPLVAALRWIAPLAILAPTVIFALRRPIAAFFLRRQGKLAKLGHQLLAGLPADASGLARDLGMTWVSWSIKLLALGWLLSRLAGIDLAQGVLGAIGGDLSTVLPIHTRAASAPMKPAY